MEWEGKDITEMVKRVQRSKRAKGAVNEDDENQPSLWYIIPGKPEIENDWEKKFRIYD